METNELDYKFFKRIFQNDSNQMESYKNVDNEFILRRKVIKHSLELIRKIFTSKRLDESNSFKLKPEDIVILDSFRVHILKDISAFGFHLFDEITGRYSYMNKLSSNEFDTSENLQSNELYSKVWLRIYNELLNPNSSLINFFYDNDSGGDLRIWGDTNDVLHLNWKKFTKQELENLEDNEICLNFYERFVAENSTIAQEISESIQKSISNLHTEVELDDDYTLDSLALKIITDLKSKSIQERLHEIIAITRYELLKNTEQIQDLFFRKIELLSFKKGKESIDSTKNELWSKIPEVREIWKNESSIRHSWTWTKVQEMLEAFQSIILNQFSFCGEDGLSLYKLNEISFDYQEIPQTIYAYVILVSGSNTDNRVVIQSLTNFLNALRDHLNENKLKTGLIRHKKPKGNKYPLAKLIKETLDPVINKSSFALDRWCKIVDNISKEAVHEKKGIEFLVGIGPKSFHELHFKKYIAPHDYLIASNVDVIKIVHFLKSYFSLFEIKNKRIIWFDDKGHFLGIFEFNTIANILSSAENQPLLLARIDGKNNFDILHKKEAEPIIRVKKGEIIELNLINDNIETPILKLTNKLFSAGTEQHKDLIKSFSTFIKKLVIKTIMTDTATSFIVYNDLCSYKYPKSDEIKWKVEFHFQSKNLSERLDKYDFPVLTKEDLKLNETKSGQELVSKIIEEILLLAKLDGSILIKLTDEGIQISPSQFTAPLINKGTKTDPDYAHFDYFELKKQGKVNNEDDEINAVNDKFYENEVTTLEDLQRFINDIDNEGDYIKGNEDLKKLAFLNSAGTRHHSLYGLSLSAKEPLYVVVLSEDGQVRIFWNGLLFYEYGSLKS
jgi:hypothetical protein